MTSVTPRDISSDFQKKKKHTLPHVVRCPSPAVNDSFECIRKVGGFLLTTEMYSKNCVSNRDAKHLYLCIYSL